MYISGSEDILTPLNDETKLSCCMPAWLPIPDNNRVHVTNERHPACSHCVKTAQAERRSHREPLSGYAMVIRGEGSAPNCVLNLYTSWKLCSPEDDEEKTSIHFPQLGNPRGSGDWTYCLFLLSFSSPPAALSPALTTCNELHHYCRFKDRAAKNNTGRVEGRRLG